VALPRPAVSDEFIVEKSQLSDIRHARVNIADIAFDADGSILVATSDGLITTPLQCYRVELQRRTDTSHQITYFIFVLISLFLGRILISTNYCHPQNYR